MRTFHYLSLVFLFLSCYQNLQAQLQISQQEIGGRMKCLAFSPNGLYYAVGTDEDTYVFNAEGKEIKKLPFPTYALQFSPDSKTILTGSVRAGLFLWSLAGGPFLKTYLSSDEQSDVTSLAFSPDGQQIVAGYKSGKIKAWNTLTGTPIQLLAPEKKIAPINNTALKKVAPAKVAEAKDTTLARSDEEDEAMVEGLTDEDTGVFGMADEYPEEEDSNDQPEKEPINPSPSILAISWSVDGKKLLICKEESTELTLIQGGKQSILLKHPFSPIVRAIFSFDGKNIITGHQNGKLCFWDLQGKLIKTIDGHVVSILSLTFTKDGKKLLSICEDGKVIVRTPLGQVVQELQTNKTSLPILNAAAFSSDGNRLITGYWSDDLRIWELKPKNLQEFQVTGGIVSSVAVSGDEKWILTGSNAGQLSLWDSARTTVKIFKHVGSKAITALAFDQSGKKILAGNELGLIHEWDHTGKLLNGHIMGRISDKKVVFLAYHPKESWIITANENGKVLILDAKTWQEIREFKVEGISEIYYTALAPDGQTLLISGAGRNALEVNLEGKPLSGLRGQWGKIRSSSFSHNGNMLLTADDDGKTLLWSRDGKVIQKLDSIADPQAVAFSKDDQAAIVVGKDFVYTFGIDGKLIKKSKINTWEETKISTHHETQMQLTPNARNFVSYAGRVTRLQKLDGTLVKSYSGHTHAPTYARFTPSGKIFTASKNEWIVWDKKLPSKVIVPPTKTKGMMCMDVSKDWSKIIVHEFEDQSTKKDSNDQIKLLDLNGNLIKSFKAPVGNAMFERFIKFSPDEKLFINGGVHPFPGKMTLTDMNDQLIHTFVHPAGFSTGTFSPDGKTILTGGRDGNVILWKLNGEIVLELKGHRGEINSVCFAPDGQSVLTGANDGSAILWDLKGNILQKFKGHKGVNQVAFAPGGKSIFMGCSSENELVIHWNLNGQIIKQYEIGNLRVTSFDFSADGKKLLIGGWNGDLEVIVIDL